MGKIDFEQGLIVGMTVAGGDKSEAKRQAIIQDLLFINIPISLQATWPEIDTIIHSLSDLLYPRLLSCETDPTGNQLIMAFNRAMTNPSGKESEFTFKMADTSKALQGLSLDPTNNHRYLSGLAEKVNYGLALKIAYTKGTVTSDDNATLQNIVDFVVTNNVSGVVALLSASTSTDGTKVILTFDKSMASVSGKQAEFGVKIESFETNNKWNGFANSPKTIADYPTQILYHYGSYDWLFVSKSPVTKNTSTNTLSTTGSDTIRYRYNGTSWDAIGFYEISESFDNILQSKNDILINGTSTIYFAKTAITTPLVISSSELDTNDNKNIILTINGEYLYQKWSDFPDSGELTSEYPYQVIYGTKETGAWLLLSKGKFYGTGYPIKNVQEAKRYVWDSATNLWYFNDSIVAGNVIANSAPKQANNNMYQDETLSIVGFAKTTTTSPKITNGQTVKTSYTKGTVKSADNGDLESYSDVSVTNAVSVPYQKWNGQPDSPILTNDFPYQCVCQSGGYLYLNVSTGKFYADGINFKSLSISKIYQKSGSTWTYIMEAPANSELFAKNGISQANADVYTDNTLTLVYFAKTT